MHAIEIEVDPPPPEDEHRRRNFVEDVWVKAWENGWVENLDFLNRRSDQMWTFSFLFPARQSHQALTLVESLIRSHFMDGVATFRHSKKAHRG